MKLDETEQAAVRNLGAMINGAIEKSFDVSRAIEDLRALGFEPHLTLKLEIALQEIGGNQAFGDDGNGVFDDETEADDVELELTEDDVQTLRRMKIRLDN